MNSKQRFIIIAILVTLSATIVSTLCAWVRVEKLERELAVHKMDAYVLKLVQEELLNRHGLHLEIELLDPKVGAVPKIGFEQNQTEQDKP